MNDYEVTADYLKKQIEYAGAKVVDVSIYPAVEHFETASDLIIIAAYLPNRACLLTAKVRVDRNDVDKTTGRFTISAELNKEGGKKYEKDEDILVDRSQKEAESFSRFRKKFSINTGTNEYTELQYGITFFEEFIKKYKKYLKEKFTDYVVLPYVPEESDELAELEKKNGGKNVNHSTIFNYKVREKFPEEYFEGIVVSM